MSSPPVIMWLLSPCSEIVCQHSASARAHTETYRNAGLSPFLSQIPQSQVVGSLSCRPSLLSPRNHAPRRLTTHAPRSRGKASALLSTPLSSPLKLSFAKKKLLGLLGRRTEGPSPLPFSFPDPAQSQYSVCARTFARCRVVPFSNATIRPETTSSSFSVRRRRRRRRHSPLS